MLLNLFHLQSRAALLQKMLLDLFRANPAQRPHMAFLAPGGLVL
jgi:hypothetical protein